MANGAGDSVSEIDTVSRSLVRTISGAQFQFSDPIALAADQGRLFVLSSAGPVTAVSVAWEGCSVSPRAISSDSAHRWESQRRAAACG